MRNYEYTKAVFDDVMKLIDSDEKIDTNDYFHCVDDSCCFDYEELRDAIYSRCIVEDITTPDFGSYIYNTKQAQKMVCKNIDTVIEALNARNYDAEAVGNYFMKENYIHLDTIAREYVLSDAVAMAVKEVSPKMD